MEKQVKLIENFVSWQGEGPDSGTTMIILRFKTCNKKCPWCDTSVKMRISSEAPYLLSDIQNTVYERAAGLLITGGEPTVDRHFDECVALLNDLTYPMANVETNGYNLTGLIKEVDPTKPVKFIYSPKIFTANDGAQAREILKEVEMTPNLFVKMVYEPDNDYSMLFLNHIVEEAPSLVKRQRVWLMPKGTTRVDLIRNAGPVFDACEKYNFNFSSRSHIIFGFV
jgi:organic radical activating enzyme